MVYRPEIDGLRSIAVLSVVVYHFGFIYERELLLSGGFLGVDVFFVISGYLITSLLLNELNSNGSIDVLKFYDRRARRILPALLIVLIFCLFFSYATALSEDYNTLAESAIASLLFISNYFFWFDSIVYDADSSIYLPLLHTWSLSVEEQFYIIFPLLLYLTHRFFKPYIREVLIFISLAGVFAAFYSTSIAPEFSFFSITSRFWELGAGSLLAFQEIKRKDRDIKKSLIKPNIFSAVGLVLILISIWLFDDSYSHPGLMTVLPVFGSILIINYARSGTFVNWVLGLRPLVFIGLISYSLYLWHYPVISYATMLTDQLDNIDRAILLLGSVFLAFATWFIVEQPFRVRPFFIRNGWKLLVMFWCVVILSSFYVVKNNGLPSRIPEPLLSMLNDLDRDTVIKNKHESIRELCEKNRLVIKCGDDESIGIPVNLIGDSHMGALRASLVSMLHKDHKITIFTKGGCWPVLGFDRISKDTGLIDSRCDAKLQAARFRVTNSNSTPSVVVIAGRLPLYLTGKLFDNQESGRESQVNGNGEIWFNYVSKKGNLSFESGVLRTIKRYLKNGHHVVLVYPIPEVGISIKRKLIRTYRFMSFDDVAAHLKANPITTSFNVYNERTRSSFELLDSVKHKNLHRVYPHKIFCNSTLSGRCITHDDSHVYYLDSHHPGYYGASLINEKIAAIVRNIDSESRAGGGGL